ncbi:uncharacterized protein [Montipora foliosa]|uniref:uncharacterized protein n=1 Tax=Montipora foliosa TaxID=591990 RepID=UPI0035F133E7
MEAQEEDPVCRQIKVYCCEGWPNKSSLNDAMKPYWSSRGELSVVQNILLKASRIVIPSSMRVEILDKIHEGHQRIAKCHYFSRYVEVTPMQTTTNSNDLLRALKSIFARHGISEQVRSDNGPQFDTAEFSYFAKEWGFKNSTSSPRFPQANGEVERGVRTVKNLLTKEKDPAKALLAYRSTPLACKFSPAQLLKADWEHRSIVPHSAEPAGA